MPRQKIVLLVGSVGLFVCCSANPGSVSGMDAGVDPQDAATPSGSDAGALVDARSDTSAATPIAVVNPGFELPATGPSTFITSAPPTGWQAYGTINNNNRAVGVLNPSTTMLYLDPVPQGNNVGVVFLLDKTQDQSFYANSEAGLQQTLTDTLLPNTEYTLSVNVGNINVDSSPNHAFAFTGFPNYRVDFLAGGQVLAADNSSLKPGEGRFLVATVKFVTGSQHAQLGQALGVRLVNLNSSVGLEVNFDNVRLERVAK